MALDWRHLQHLLQIQVLRSRSFFFFFFPSRLRLICSSSAHNPDSRKHIDTLDYLVRVSLTDWSAERVMTWNQTAVPPGQVSPRFSNGLFIPAGATGGGVSGALLSAGVDGLVLYDIHSNSTAMVVISDPQDIASSPLLLQINSSFVVVAQDRLNGPEIGFLALDTLTLPAGGWMTIPQAKCIGPITSIFVTPGDVNKFYITCDFFAKTGAVLEIGILQQAPWFSIKNQTTTPSTLCVQSPYSPPLYNTASGWLAFFGSDADEGNITVVEF
jgi:hypothetical protein